MKKLLSITLAILLIATSFSMLGLCASAETFAAGTYPYAANGVKAPIVRNSTTDEVYAYNDFFTKVSVDSLTDSNFTSTFKPYNSATANFTEGNAKITASLESYSETADNVYGTSGKSYKASYTSASGRTITPANGVEQYYHFLRVTSTYMISSDNKDTASIGFWVKTEYPMHIAVRLYINNSGYIISERMEIPAGESFVEIPLSNFVTLADNFAPLHATYNDVRIYHTDIYFRARESFTDTRDIWFDNIGVYNYTSNGGKALHSSNAIAKDSIEKYVQNGSTVTRDGMTWNADSYGTISVCDPESGTANPNAYNSVGQSLHYSTTKVTTTDKFRFRTNRSINTNNADGTPTGINAILSVWIKTDRAIKIFLTADDSTTANSGTNRYRSNEYFLPAGESILQIPVSDFDEKYYIDDAHDCDYAYKWDYLGSINFYFTAAVSVTDNRNANVYVDNIAIIPGEVSECTHVSTKDANIKPSTYFVAGTKDVVCTDCGETVEAGVALDCDTADAITFIPSYEGSALTIEWKYSEALLTDIHNADTAELNLTCAIDGKEIINLPEFEAANVGGKIEIEGFNATRLNQTVSLNIAFDFGDAYDDNLVAELNSKANYSVVAKNVVNESADNEKVTDLIEAIGTQESIVVNGNNTSCNNFDVAYSKVDIANATAEFKFTATDAFITAVKANDAYRDGRTVNMVINIGGKDYSVKLNELRTNITVTVKGLSFSQMYGDITAKLVITYTAEGVAAIETDSITVSFDDAIAASEDSAAIALEALMTK